MPPDVAPAMSSLAPYRWLRVASAPDFAGELDGARDVLDRLESKVPPQLPAPDAAEFLALVCARRGRLARQRGEIDAAVDWSQRGLARADGARHLDAWGACIQGLAACAQFRVASTGRRIRRETSMGRSNRAKCALGRHQTPRHTARAAPLHRARSKYGGLRPTVRPQAPRISLYPGEFS